MNLVCIKISIFNYNSWDSSRSSVCFAFLLIRFCDSFSKLGLSAKLFSVLKTRSYFTTWRLWDRPHVTKHKLTLRKYVNIRIKTICLNSILWNIILRKRIRCLQLGVREKSNSYRALATCIFSLYCARELLFKLKRLSWHEKKNTSKNYGFRVIIKFNGVPV